jgi:hypothetical protein
VEGELIALAVTAVFVGGGFYYMVQRMKRDMNGIGKRLAETIHKEAARHHNLGLAVMATAPEEKKTEIAALLREEV